MDLEAAHDRNAPANKLTRVGMALCFLISGGILLGTLAMAAPDPLPASVTSSAAR